MKIKEMPMIERPREKLIELGRDNLTDQELIAIILKTGTKDKSVKEISYELFKKIEDITYLENITLGTLTSIKGIGKVKAIELLASIELGKRIFLKKNDKKKKYKSAREIYEDMRYLFFNKEQEYFYCLYFNNKRELIERKLLFMGTINKSIVHPREIFKTAYLQSASSIICMHNHPSNDVNPSREDIEFTKNIVSIGKMNGIYVTDHIIVGNESFYSFYEENIIDF